MSVWLNLKQIVFQALLRSKPVRENFQDIENAINDIQSQINNLTTPPVGNEVTNARDYHTVLRDRLRSSSKGHNEIIIEGGGVEAQSTPDMTVKVKTGEAIINGVACKWSEQNSGTITAPTNKRLDVVVINNDNSLSIVSGVDSVDPFLPVITNTQRPLAILTLDSSTTQITNSEIEDASQQGCFANEKWFWKIQDAVDELGSRTNEQEKGDVFVRKGTYYEEVDLTNKNYITINFENGAYIKRVSNTLYCIKSINTPGTRTKGLEIFNAKLLGNGKAGSVELLRYEYTDEFIIDKCYFDGNVSSTATYKNYVIDNCEKFYLSKNMPIDSSNDIDYNATTNITNSIEYLEDGYHKGHVMFCGDNTEKSRLLKRGWTEITSANNRFLRIETNAQNTGGSDTKDLNHNHRWYNNGASPGSTHRSFDSAGNYRNIINGGSAASTLGIRVDPQNTNMVLGNYPDDWYTDKQLSAAQDIKPAYYSLTALIHR